MKTLARSFLVLAAAAVICPHAPADDKVLLQGLWKVMQALSAGSEMPTEQREQARLEFKENKALPLQGGQIECEAEFAIDETKKPKTIDLKIAAQNKTFLGIYELEGDMLKICFAEKYRPREFASQAGDKSTLLVLKRTKK